MQIWSEYGKLGEYLVANHLLSKGYDVRVSSNSNGSADILAWGEHKLLIQVKTSAKSAHIKSKEINRLKRTAKKSNARAVIAIVYANNIEFYLLDEWQRIDI